MLPLLSQIVDLLGQAAFSRAVQALDLQTGALVCLKIIKVRPRLCFAQGLHTVGCHHRPCASTSLALYLPRSLLSQNNKDYFDQGLDKSSSCCDMC